MRSRLRHRRKWAFLAVASAITALLLFPVYWMVLSSLLPVSEIQSSSPPVIPNPSHFTLKSYQDVFDAPVFLWLRNSVVVMVGTVFFSTVVSTLAGYSLSRFELKGRYVLASTLLLARMLPGTLLIVPMFMLFSVAHLTNSLWGLILVDTTLVVPFSTWMLKGFFDSIPRELEESALVDGASRLGALWRIVLPLAMPGVATAVVFGAIVGWSDFLFARTLMTDASNWTVTVGLVSFRTQYQVNWGGQMAYSVVSLLPMILLFIVFERFLVSGLTSGATKG